VCKGIAQLAGVLSAMRVITNQLLQSPLVMMNVSLLPPGCWQLRDLRPRRCRQLLQLYPVACTAASSTEVDASVPQSWRSRYSNFGGTAVMHQKPLLRHATRLVHILEAERPPKSLASMTELLASSVTTLVSQASEAGGMQGI